MMLLGISILPKQNIQNGRMCAKNAIFLFQVFSVPSHISVSLALIRQVAWLLGKLMVDNIIYQIKRYLCITNKRERYGVQHHFQQYFSYIVAVSFICGGNRCTQSSLPNLIT